MPFGRFRIIAVACGLTMLVWWAGCGGGGGSKNSNPNPGANTAAIVVNAGPAGNYANGLFTTVTICVSGTSNCQAVSGVLVDTGSFGVRILSTALTPSLSSALSQEKGASGNSIAECAQFSDGITWGPVKTADVKIASEDAAAIPIQVIGDPAFSAVPAGCSNTGAPEDTLQKLGANGILGIGPFVQDCPACAPGTTNNQNFYYACAGSSCSATTVGFPQQVQNPVAAFSTDNNGVLVELPVVASSTTTVSGSLIFGIGTQSDNGLGSAHVYTIDTSTANAGNINTTFQGKSYPSFLDTGSNAYFFLDSGTTGMPTCPSPESGFYCPPSRISFSATNTGTNNASTTISFSIDNADTLFSNTAATVFPTLGGPNTGMFDWGLPFFYGRNVFIAIDGAQTPGGVGPYWAY
jgi:Protein of unknown function (DUF3443)